MNKPLRTIAPPFVVATPSGARIRTRLKVSDTDAAVLFEVGAHLGSLAGRDLVQRCRAGEGNKHAGRGPRKKALTAESSSRWAGAITRITADQWERAHQNLEDDRANLRKAIYTIDRRLAVPVGERKGRTTGYYSQAERWAKQQRRQHLASRLTDVENRLSEGRVSVVRGGRRLAKNRHNLDAAGLTPAEWRSRWQAARLFLHADGEASLNWGNGTIRVHPDTGVVTVRLPTPLAHLSNTPTPHPTYQLSCTAVFNHLADVWAAQATNAAVAYTVTFNPERERWYIDASWKTRTVSAPSLEHLQRSRTLGVDLNDGHLAAWVVAADGNPIGEPYTVKLELSGLSASARDGRLRAAVTELITIAKTNGCPSVTIENLNFSDARATGRETMGRGKHGKRFRRTVSGIPTGRFRDRLAGMAANAGLAVIAVDPAYTSKWGGQHWQKPLNDRTNADVTVSRHHAAAVVIARRSLGHRARRRVRVTDPHKLMGVGELRPRPDVTPGAVTPTPPGSGGTLQHRLKKTSLPPPVSKGGPRDPTPFGVPGGTLELTH